MTRRCTQRQFLLRPDEVVEDIVLYCLAVAAERYGISLNAYVAMSNHEHLVVRDNLGNFPEFLAYHHRLVAMAMNVHRGRCENFWAAEPPNAVHLVEAHDRFAALIYVLANPVASDLVERAIDWPGASSLALHISGRTTLTVKRPRLFFLRDGKMPKEATLHIARLDGFEDLTEEEWIAKIDDAVCSAEDRARHVRRAAGRCVVGRKAILRAVPTDTPKAVEGRRASRPFLACRNLLRRAREAAAYFLFQRERRAAWLRTRAGEQDVRFPFGTYRVWGFFVTRPPADDLCLVA